MKQNKWILFLALVIPMCLNAQNTGFAGKRVLTKINLLEGKYAFFDGLDIEFIPLRNTTISIGLNSFKMKTPQKYNKKLFDGGFPKSKMPDKAIINRTEIKIEARQYIKSILYPPAPQGLFLFANVRIAEMDIKGNYYISLTHVISDESVNEYISYEFKNLASVATTAGFGYQYFINNWLTFGFSAGLFYSNVKGNLGFLPKTVLQGVRNNLYPNLISFGSNEKSLFSAGIITSFQIGAIFF